MIQKIYKINWLFIFIVIILASIGFIALYSAADGNIFPWALNHFYRCILGFLVIIFIESFTVIYSCVPKLIILILKIFG